MQGTGSAFGGSSKTQSKGFAGGGRSGLPPLGRKEGIPGASEAAPAISEEELKRRKAELEQEKKNLKGVFSFGASNEAKEIYSKLDELTQKAERVGEVEFNKELEEVKEKVEETEKEQKQPRAGFKPDVSPVSAEKKEATVSAGTDQGLLVKFFGYQASKGTVDNSKQIAEKGDVGRAKTWLAGLVWRLFQMRKEI